MDELVASLHVHTIYSDGSGTHAEIAHAALQANLDVLLVTDHNTWVQGVEKYYQEGKKRLLLLSGEEVHDQGRDPQKNHLLVFGAERELSCLADDTQALITAVRETGGVCFLAHPVDTSLPLFGETDISWEDWGVAGYHGLEIWNGFSELKVVTRNRFDALFYAYFPQAINHGPVARTMRIWDSLLARGQNVVAVGGSDAHARRMSLGFLHKVIFPYHFHFSTVNTHLLTPAPLSGNLLADRRMIYTALASGHCFIGYDLPCSTKGFHFSAQGKEQDAIMGDAIRAEKGITLQIRVPAPGAEIHLLKDGRRIELIRSEAVSRTTTEPGIYRVEVYRRFLGALRCWIISNPIYIQ